MSVCPAKVTLEVKLENPGTSALRLRTCQVLPPSRVKVTLPPVMTAPMRVKEGSAETLRVVSRKKEPPAWMLPTKPAAGKSAAARANQLCAPSVVALRKNWPVLRKVLPVGSLFALG